MKSRKLEITLHYAKGLFDVKFFGTMNPYAIVWIAGNGKESKPRTTAVAINGGSSPIWNCPLQFNVPPMHKNYSLFCVIKHDGTLFDRDIGEVEVPFADLLAGNGSGEKLSFPVKIYSGEANGEIILSHKFIEKNGKEYVDGGSRKKVRRKKKNGGMIIKIARAVAKVLKLIILAAKAALGVTDITLGLEDLLDALGDDYEDDEYEDDGEEDEYEDDEEEDEYEDDEYEDEY